MRQAGDKSGRKGEGTMYTHKRMLIIKTEFGRYRVNAYAYGDQPGEDGHTFKTLRAAKAFIDRMDATITNCSERRDTEVPA